MKGIACIISAFCLCLSACFCFGNNYNREGYVIHSANGIVTVEDERGFIWDFEGDDFHNGEKVVLHMNINGTDSNIFDDIVKYAEKV